MLNQTECFQQNIIIDDVTNPEITCIDNQNVTADETHTYTVTGTEFNPANVNDNCDIANIVNNFNNNATLDGASLPEDNTTITWTITDNAGNETQCSFDVVVNAYVGTNNLNTDGILISPNPTEGIFTIDIQNIERPCRILINDI